MKAPVTLLLLAFALALVCCVLAEESVRPSALQPHALPSRLQASSNAAHATQRAKRAAVQKGKRSTTGIASYYHSTKQIYDEIKSLASRCDYLHIDWARAPESVDGDRGVSLMTVRLNYEPDTKKSERALLFFGEHARELISPETGLEFLRRACDPAQLNTKYKNVDAPLIDILRSTEFLIFPNANPSGRRISERGNYCNRVNERGVDLNRNWGTHWSSKSRHKDTYPGTKAWSESETVILAHTASKFAPTIFISVHSGSLNMLSPFAYKGSTAGEPASNAGSIDPPAIDVKQVPHDGLHGTGLKPVLKVLKHVNRDFCRCVVGAAGKELGYLSPGTCLDYMYNRVGTRYAFALEIYSGESYAGARGSALIEEEMKSEIMSTVNDREEHEEIAEEEAAAAEEMEENSLMEVESEFFSRAETEHSLEEYPSFDLPSFTETSSTHTISALTDADKPESDKLFPRSFRGRNRRCLYNFNPVTRRMYERTVDHWSRGLLSLVHTIQSTRPKAAAAAAAEDSE